MSSETHGREALTLPCDSQRLMECSFLGGTDRLLQGVDEELIAISSFPGLIQSGGHQVEGRPTHCGTLHVP